MKIFSKLVMGAVLFFVTNGRAQIITPADLDGWAPVNVRADATVAITGDEPRSGLGSLKFSFVTVTPGQDKADFEKVWGVVPGRTLGSLTALSYEFYRSSSSTTAGHFAPVLRLLYLTTSGESGYLIWEPIYNGYASITTDTWNSADIFSGNFWMRAFGPGRTIDDYNVSLAEWIANTDEEGSPIDDDSDSDVPHVLSASTYIIGVNVGVGSGWGSTFLGYVDNVELEWSSGAEVESANFELPPPCTTDCYVDDAVGNDANGGTNPTTDAKKTIQNAVNTVNTGGTVHVAGGTYVEQVEIDKALTVRGAGATTVVESPATLTKYFTTSANNYPIIWVHDTDDVTIEDLVVDGAGKGNANYRFVGIGYDNAGGTIEDVEIKDIRNTPIDGSQHGVGILANSAEGTARTLTVNRCDIHDYQKNATVFNGADLTATITNNTITGAGAVAFIAQNGIQVSFGATAEVNGNTVSGHSYTPFTFVSTGVLLYFSDVNTDNNDVLENQVGLYHINGSGLHQKNEVSASAVGTGSPFFWGIVADPGDAPRAIPDPFDGPVATNNAAQSKKSQNTIAATFTQTYDQNVLTGDGSASGIGLEGDVFGTDVLDLTATANIITKWAVGVTFYKDPGATLIANLIDCNQIYDNTIGVDNPTGVVVNAVGNWWGAGSGPTHASNPGGSGDVVSDDVTFAPWGADATCGGSVAHNFVFLADTEVKIERTKQTPPHGLIHSNGNVFFKRGDPSEYDATVTAVGDVKIVGDENTIDGDVTAGGTIKLDAGSTITGTATSGGSVASVAIPSLSFSAGGPNHTIAKGKMLALAPGSYGTVTINKGATLKLKSGDYYFDQLLNKGSDAVFEFDVASGGVTLNVVTKLEIAKDMEFRILVEGESGSEKITVNTMQSTKLSIGKEGYILCTLNAPNAAVVLGNNTQFRGGICAKSIEVLRDCLWYGHNSPGSLPGPDQLPKFVPDEEEDGDEEVISDQSTVVSDYALEQNYPNPFNPSTKISFALPERGVVQLRIFNGTGQLVRTLMNHEMAQGRHELVWDGRNQIGETVATGIYLYRITVQDQTGATTFSETRRMSFVK